MEILTHQSHTIATLGRLEENVWEQTLNCLAPEEGSIAVINGDNHLGYSQPIGVGVGYADHISVSGVGYDIACGNKAVLTDLFLEDVKPFIPSFMDEIATRIPFGMGGRQAQENRIDHPVFEKIRNAAFEPQRKLADLAEAQLGTTGTGNHYVDILVDEMERIWIGVHFGSRGFGHKTATGFLAVVQGLPFDERERKEKHLKVEEKGGMMAAPALLAVDSEAGQAYIEAMTLAGEYAYAGRDVVCETVLDILGGDALHEVHNHHNFAWREEHGGRDLWVVRKGCTPAYPGQEGFVGATMGENSVILEGTDAGAPALYSTVHGAGRVMSRTKAKGKMKRKKVYECQDRDCTRTFVIDGINPQNPPPKKGACPDHPEARVKKRWVFERVKGEAGEPAIDWDAEQKALGEIELRGGAADEAPGAYKRLADVLRGQGDTIRVLHQLRPLGVSMAPADHPERPDD